MTIPQAVPANYTRLRIGVDVGGTFTKAVALRLDPVTIVAQAIVPTTHHDPAGVARGVIDALTQVLAQVGDSPIAAVSHSTTQAVNALLEGDVTPVGIVGSGPASEAARLKKRISPGAIQLAPGRTLPTFSLWMDSPITPEQATGAVTTLIAQGAGAIVASGMYSVDDPDDELKIMAAALVHGLPAVGGHQVSSNYGLEVRTTTAAINASIVPRMIQTGEQVEACLREANVHAPLLIMRGDGGLTDADALRTRPILSLLSGPAASLAGALLFGRVLDGIFIEVGGTSTNLGIIRDGQPVLRYVQIMAYPTCIRSLDVRVQGIAGGSMARLRGRKLVDVGPRSAHIAGLPYLCFSQPDGTLTADLIAPKPGDPADYVTVTDTGGKRYALTVTCAAAALGRLPGNDGEAARKGFAALGQRMGVSAEAAARMMLDLAARGIASAVEALCREYKLTSPTLIGGGGGAAALVPAVAERLKLSHQLTPYAEVISSIGVALALVREEVERGIDSVTPEAVAGEASERAAASGADPSTIEVTTELIPERGTIRAVASGSLALDGVNRSAQSLNPSELQAVAARRVGLSTERVTLLAVSGRNFVYTVTPKRTLFNRDWSGVIVVDAAGVVRLTAEHAQAFTGDADAVVDAIRKFPKPDSTRLTLVDARRMLSLGDAVKLDALETTLRSATPPLILVLEPLSWW